MPLISIIFPTFNESGNLVELYNRLSKAINEIADYDFEIIFVDDCSTDESPMILQSLSESDSRITIIRFSRNCGSHAAIMAGLYYCKGDAAAILASDLQDPPEIIHQLILKWETGFKVVWGVRKKREGEKIQDLFISRFFYYLMNCLTDVKQPPTGADVFLIDRKVIDAYKNTPEKNTSVFMLIAWIGFSQTSILYSKEPRYSGYSKWNTSKRLKLFYDSLISFSYIPLRFMSLIGFLTSLLGMLYSIVIFINAMKGFPVEGWTSLMIVVLVLGGIQLIMMGLLGEYLWRTYDEARGRPRFVIEQNTLFEDSGIQRKKKDENKN
jgi:polyisoprenyl-phosphate glycosyltransferase